MKRFHSYGPVNAKHHFCVERRELVRHCMENLVGDPDEGGCYFTIWAPRQTGKTWLIREMQRVIPEHYASVLPLDPLDEMDDVFGGDSLDLPALLRRYKDFLARLKAKGINPRKDRPRRKTDFHLTEAVGHFHLYTWLRDAIGKRCVVSPEFPTGNGKVDLRLQCGEKNGIIEVKSYVSAWQAKLDREQAARYAKNMGLDSVALAVFLPVGDEAVLEKISSDEVIDGVRVQVTAIGWE